MEQIVALSQISGLCRQAINFGCYSAQLSNNLNVNLGWWTDRNGKLLFSLFKLDLEK